ncbi:MAG: hypothetical protein ACOCXZ_02220 [Chloroflexota bacterium]
MHKMVIVITPLVDQAAAVARAWEAAGATGVTFIESYGLRRLHETSHSHDVLPGMMSMLELLRTQQQSSVTLLSVVNPGLVEPMKHCAHDLLGDLGGANNGVLFVLDVEQVVGVQHRRG